MAISLEDFLSYLQSQGYYQRPDDKAWYGGPGQTMYYGPDNPFGMPDSLAPAYNKYVQDATKNPWGKSDFQGYTRPGIPSGSEFGSGTQYGVDSETGATILQGYDDEGRWGTIKSTGDGAVQEFLTGIDTAEKNAGLAPQVNINGQWFARLGPTYDDPNLARLGITPQYSEQYGYIIPWSEYERKQADLNKETWYEKAMGNMPAYLAGGALGLGLGPVLAGATGMSTGAATGAIGGGVAGGFSGDQPSLKGALTGAALGGIGGYAKDLISPALSEMLAKYFPQGTGGALELLSGSVPSDTNTAGLYQMGIDAGLSGDALQAFVDSGGTAGSTAAGGGGVASLLGGVEGIYPPTEPTGSLTEAQQWARTLGGLNPDGSINWQAIDQSLTQQGITGIDGSSFIPAGLSAAGAGSGLTGLSKLLESAGLPPGVASLLGPVLPSLLGAGLGAAAGGSPSTTTQTNDLPAWALPYAQKLLGQGSRNLDMSALSAGESDTIAKLVASLQQPNAGLEAANKSLTDTAGGKYLDIATNPQWQDLSRQITEKYQNTIQPTTNAQFSRAGAMGVGNSAWEQFLGQQQTDLSRGLATGAANIYGNERGLQQQASLAMPNFQTQALTQLPNAALTAQGYGRNVANTQLQSGAGLLGAIRGGTTTQQSQNSLLNNILGGALTGGALGRLWG
jgi:hypothetical protein